MKAIRLGQYPDGRVKGYEHFWYSHERPINLPHYTRVSEEVFKHAMVNAKVCGIVSRLSVENINMGGSQYKSTLCLYKDAMVTIDEPKRKIKPDARVMVIAVCAKTKAQGNKKMKAVAKSLGLERLVLKR